MKRESGSHRLVPPCNRDTAGFGRRGVASAKQDRCSCNTMTILIHTSNLLLHWLDRTVAFQYITLLLHCATSLCASLRQAGGVFAVADIDRIP